MKLTAEQTLEYLDNCIRSWRINKDGAMSSLEYEMAVHYIDAFQSVRMTLFGATL